MPAAQTLFSRVTESFPLELLIVGLIGVLIVIDGLRNGTRHATIFVLAASLTLVLYNAIFRAAFVASKLTELSETMKSGVFLSLLVFLCVLLYRLVPTYFGSGPSLTKALAGGLAVAVVLLVVWLQIPALSVLREPLPAIQNLFGTTYYFFWLVGAYALLALVRR